MTEVSSQRIVINLAGQLRRVLNSSSIIIGIFGLLGVYGAVYTTIFSDGINVVLAILFMGLPGLLFVSMCVIGLTKPINGRTLTIDAVGFHHWQKGTIPFTVRWSELAGITVVMAYRRMPGTSNTLSNTTIAPVIAWLDWYPAEGEPRPRSKEIAGFWERAGAEGHYRMDLPARRTLARWISEAVATYHPELWLDGTD
ncbi:hypothetical protein [Labedaea rhizosphaerae]|uniref:Uncharacterized protein n=1 Tax=Labedaea rhizosphaerae TaxID=598644 RepID=A0A4R6S5R3_LABRH|nr:hypothetical protein [Labedaea rhizosphaerae]TDP95179.1 hypothetical protein EV186_105411 [Labedaea rhizosphaerae]